MNAAIDVHRDDPAFGYRFITDELQAAGSIAVLVLYVIGVIGLITLS